MSTSTPCVNSSVSPMREERRGERRNTSHRDEVEMTEIVRDRVLTTSTEGGGSRVPSPVKTASPINLSPVASPVEEGSPLLAAVGAGQEDVVKALLENEEIDLTESDDQGRTALHIACQKGHGNIVRLLLQAMDGVGVCRCDVDHHTALMCAILNNHTDCVRHILNEKHAHVNYVTTQGGDTPLIMASRTGNREIVELLLQKGATSILGTSTTPMREACRGGHTGVVSLLLEDKWCCREEVNARHPEERTTPLDLAIEGENTEVVSLLLLSGYLPNPRTSTARARAVRFLCEQRFDPNASNETTGFTILMAASEAGLHREVRILAEAGSVIDARDRTGDTALSIAVSQNDFTIADLLFDYGADPFTVKRHRIAACGMALIKATRHGNLEGVQALLQHTEFDISCMRCVNAEGCTALHIACKEGWKDIARLLLKRGKGVAIDQRDGEGTTPLHYAVLHNQPEIVLLLIDHGADTKIPFQGLAMPVVATMFSYGDVGRALEVGERRRVAGETLLTVLRKGESGEETARQVGELLREKEININLRDAQGESPLTIACTHKNMTNVFDMLAHDPRILIDQTNGKGQTALMIAIDQNYPDRVRILIDCDADVNVSIEEGKVKRGATALSLACLRGRMKIVRMLLGTQQCNVNHPMQDGRTPFTIATQEGDSRMMELLASHKARVATDAEGGGKVLLEICREPFTHPETLATFFRLTRSQGIDINVTGKNGLTPLLEECQHLSSPQKTTVLLAEGADVRRVTPQGETALMLASRTKADVLTALMDAEKKTYGSCEIDRTDNEGHTALHKAVEGGNSQAINILVASGADPFAGSGVTDSDSNKYARNEMWSAFMIREIRMGNRARVERALASGGTKGINYGDNYGNTPLIIAIGKGDTEMTALLLRHGASLTRSNDKCVTPLMEACSGGHIEIVRLLLAQERKLTQADLSIASNIARKQGHMEILAMLDHETD
ncbi:MAG: ankyrin repeat domain-containing protein [Simkaniaceae bacterium]|nr:ankyrin repeat domain-containing protein [Simkaniaceae bacterium]